MILDASALMALFNQEPGQDLVAEAIASGAGVCTVNVAEAAAVLIRAGLPPEQARSLIEPLPVTIHAADLPLALTAAQLERKTKQFGLSLGDRFCLALAERESQAVLTADRTWLQAGPLIGLDIRLIR
jgi:ribonuclease VapC